MKNIHFFGCSFTAGDELADDEFAPWKKECTTPQEYHQRRLEFMKQGKFDISLYIEACKKLSYPARLNSNNIRTYNHSNFGASIKECSLNIIKIVSTETNVDCVFLQLPPCHRELYLESVGQINSIQMSAMSTYPRKEVQHYIESKIVSHDLKQWTAEYLMDLIMIGNFVKSKNIPFYAITLGSQFYHTRTNVWPALQYLNKEVMNLNLIDLDATYPEFQNSILLGRHYGLPVHLKIAEVLKPIIDNLN